METASIVASFVSLIVSIMAIWFSFYFYNQSKNTENRVHIALEAIKTQTDTLQAINAKTLDRLTKFVTTPRDEPGQAEQLVAILRDLPDIVLRLHPPSESGSNAVIRREILNCYIPLWNYTGTTNIWASYCLPNVEDFDESNSYHQVVKRVIDRSYADFHYMASLLNQFSPDEIRASAYPDLYDEAKHSLTALVGDTAQHFARQSKE